MLLQERRYDGEKCFRVFEATIEGEILGEAARQMAFFDTRYALCKGKYEIGKTYKFRLAAFAYDAQVLPDKDREFRIPMIARKSLFDVVPETDDPVRGMLWLQGYCAETLEEKDQDR